MQITIVILILLACVAYTARRLWRRFTRKRPCDCDCGCEHDDHMRCAGCPLAESCHTKKER